jgi:hypothetical protein
MNKNIKKIVYEILKNDEYTRSNDNALIFYAVQKLNPELAGSKFVEVINSKISLEGITRARRQFFKDFPELNPRVIKEIRQKEEKEYRTEYANKSEGLER